MGWYFNPFTRKLDYAVAVAGTGYVNKSGTPVQYDYARFTDADTVEGRSYSEVLGDLSGEALAAFDFNGQDIENTGSIDAKSVVIDGGQTVKRTATGAADYNPSALTTDYIIAVDNTTAARAVTISTEDVESGSTSKPRVFVIKDESGGAAGNNITVSLESGGTIDGAASYVLDQPYQSITLYLNGTNGFII